MANELNNTVFDWDSPIPYTESGFTLLPDGDYPFTVTAFERGQHNGSAKLPPCPKAILTLEVDGGDAGRATVTHNLFLHGRCAGLITEFLVSVGLMQPGEDLARIPWNKVEGSHGVCTLGVREWTGNDGEKRKSNQVRRFLRPQAAAAGGWKAGQF